MLREVLAAAACLLAGSTCLASAAGKPHWSKVDLTEATHLGEMRVQMEAKVVGKRRYLSKLNVWMNGTQLRIPSRVNLKVEDPQLHNVEVIYTASITCIDDDCPRAGDYPVWLMINFGPTFRRDSDDKKSPTCEESTLFIDVFADRIGEIERVDCKEESEVRKNIYDPGSPAPAKMSKAQQEFESDPSMLGIDSERWSFIVDRAHAGLDLAEQQSSPEVDYKTEWLLRTDRALKEDALRLVLLRNRLLQMGLLKEEAAQTTDWPQWVFEPPSSDETPDTLEERLDWLSAEASKLTDIGCEIGRKKTDDSLFCSVE